jgi:predicted transcriptional regulator
VVELYFLRGLNQRAIATLLGITQQAVSEHLSGKMRTGVSVGGALRKLHKACATRGVRW